VTSLMTITVDYRAGEEGPLAALGRGALGIVTPIQEAISGIFRPVGTFFSTLANLGDLKAENARLRARLEQLTGEQAQILDLQRQNDLLRRQLDLKERLGFETRGATVIGESVSNFEWAVIIDRGSDDGVRLDMPVLAAEGLVGRVVKVSGGSSKVRLIIDPRSRVAVRLSSTGEQGVLVGRRAGQDLRLDLVDPETEVAAAEPVITSGFEGAVFPPGIPVGVVSEVIPSAVDLSKHVMVRPLVDVSRLDHVLVVYSSFAQANPGA
jgi:rod shape-determining protein MreC